jgi:hypothetical protein
VLPFLLRVGASVCEFEWVEPSTAAATAAMSHVARLINCGSNLDKHTSPLDAPEAPEAPPFNPFPSFLSFPSFASFDSVVYLKNRFIKVHATM